MGVKPSQRYDKLFKKFQTMKTVTREQVQKLCGGTNTDEYRRFLQMIRDADIHQLVSDEGRPVPRMVWPGPLLFALRFATDADIDPEQRRKQLAEDHAVIAETWVKAVMPAITGFFVQLYQKHPRGVILSVFLCAVGFCMLLSVSSYVLGAKQPPHVGKSHETETTPVETGVKGLKTRYYKGEDVLQAVSELIEDSSYGEERADALVLKATILNQRNQVDAAIKCAEVARSIYEDLGVLDEVFVSRVQLAKLFILNDDIVQADFQLSLANRMLKEVSTSKQAFFHTTMSKLAQEQGDDEIALYHAWESVNKYHETGLDAWEFDARTTVIYLLIKTCQLDDAVYQISINTLMENDIKSTNYVFYVHHLTVKRIWFKRTGRNIPDDFIQEYLSETYNPSVARTFQEGFEWGPCETP